MIDYDYGASIDATLQQAADLRNAIMQDVALTQQGKRQRLAQRVDPLQQRAQAEAQRWVNQLRRQYDQADAAYLAARQADAATKDTAKEMLALNRARLATQHDDWPAIQAKIDSAIEMGSREDLTAWSDVAGAIRNRFRNSSHGTDAMDYKRKVDQALAAMEPETVKETRAAVQEAAQALQTAVDKLGVYDFGSDLRGEPKLFDQVLNPPGETVNLGGPGDPNGWAITTSGRMF